MSNARESTRRENESVLQSMERDGVDLRVEHSVEFAHLACDKASAEAFAAVADSMGYQTTIYAPDEESLEDGDADWDVICTQTFVPTVDAVTDRELALGVRASELGCTPDGWGFES